ncbi:ABC transporter substrate-binding protein [Kineococcus sp. TBRC 1896]|uniref:ABC transporter substrate-binding protein n=1 Tax=Kineococcus mangrovi TaxID=1660183 RepID=A0ABV4I6P0_9ACTN
MRFSRVRNATLSAVAGVVLLSTTVTACGGSSPADGDGGSATAGTVNWWSWTPDNDLAAREIAAFNEQYPDIEVIYKKVPTDNYAAVLRPALASDDGPDVFTVNASGSFSAEAFAPYSYDLAPDVEELLGPDWRNEVYEGGVEAFTVDDRLVAAQWAKVGAGIMWINKDVFDRYGLVPPTTMAEWVQVCRTFRAEGLGCFREGLAGTSGFIVDTVHSIADSVRTGSFQDAVTGEMEWTDPAIVEALGLLRELSRNGVLDEGSVGIQQYPDVNNAFLTGQVPMVQMGTWYQQYATVNSLTAALDGAGVPADTPRITIVPVPFPDVAGYGNPSTMFADPDAGQAVNLKSGNRNAAVTFALWLGHTQEGQQVVANNMDSFPTLEGVGPEFDEIEFVNPDVQLPELQEVSEQLARATDARSRGISAELNQAIIDAAQAMVNSDTPPEDAAAAIQKVADAQR